jgi:putative phosphoribosyl transferase
MLLTLQPYRDRIEAGQVLGRHLAHYASRVDALVLGLPPGGVPIAAEVANYLNAPLDTLLVRKLESPGRPGLALGAIASGGVSVLDDEAIRQAGTSRAEVAAIAERERGELERCEQLYRGTRPAPPIAGRIVIVVTDGLATGFFMHAAVIALHQRQPAWLVVAAPVGTPEACDDLAQEVHELVCPLRPHTLETVGQWYDHFAPTDDEEVRACLRRVGGLGKA